MTYINFQMFLNIFLVVLVEIVDLALRTVIDSFEIHTINSVIKKKFKTNFIMPKALFGVAQPKKKQKILLILLKKVLGHGNQFLIKISSCKHETSSKIFTFAMTLFFS